MRTSHRVWVPWLLAWPGGAVLAILNGTVRELVIVPLVGDATGRHASTISLLLLLTAYIWLLHRRWPVPTSGIALAIGLAWVAMTIGFEFGFGHFVEGKTWVTLLEDYDLSAGRIWILVPLWTAVAPTFVRRAQTRQPVRV